MDSKEVGYTSLARSAWRRLHISVAKRLLGNSAANALTNLDHNDNEFRILTLRESHWNPDEKSRSSTASAAVSLLSSSSGFVDTYIAPVGPVSPETIFPDHEGIYDSERQQSLRQRYLGPNPSTRIPYHAQAVRLPLDFRENKFVDVDVAAIDIPGVTPSIDTDKKCVAELLGVSASDNEQMGALRFDVREVIIRAELNPASGRDARYDADLHFAELAADDWAAIGKVGADGTGEPMDP